MTQKTIKIFISKVYSKPPKNFIAYKKTDVYHIEFIWSLDLLNLNDYGLEINRGYRYVLVVIAKFLKSWLDISLEKKCSNNKRLF